MKKYSTIILFACIVNFAFGQTEKQINKTVVGSFEKYYNEGNYEAIFSSFSLEMQKALPIEKTKEFLQGLKTQCGKINNKNFVTYEDTYASYKINFEKTIFILNISVDNISKINGLLVKPFKENSTPKLIRNITKLNLPFIDVWTVVWGGDTKALNYHVDNEAQKNAFDMVITNEKGNSFITDGQRNEDYYAYGKELIAPCNGEIVMVVDGIKDNKPGILNPIYVPGNTVVIKTSNNEYLFFAHFKQNSIVVKQGQKINQGQRLGLCGNSGNSSEPHLHFHIQNEEDMNTASGIKCYFNEVMVNGQTKNDYSPIQKDKIENGEK